MLPELQQARGETDSYDDLVFIMKSFPKLPPPPENPSVTDLLGLSEEDLASVWDRFQFSIAKRNIYSEKINPRPFNNAREFCQLVHHFGPLLFVLPSCENYI